MWVCVYVSLCGFECGNQIDFAAAIVLRAHGFCFIYYFFFEQNNLIDIIMISLLFFFCAIEGNLKWKKRID